VVVGPREALARERVMLREINWLGSGDWPEVVPADGIAIAVKLRSAQPAVPARLFADGDGAVLRLDAPQHGVAPGQAAVFYDGDRVLGGGWITGAA
ncbi:MAG: tRNA 2-thiouridine(34) synthase MnmA, partial [Alphaproteobacteria bacterium]|nr:tRNA 2-thiouridine(34) synthase MnmA [Alphaproteobacteria bacterium]